MSITLSKLLNRRNSIETFDGFSNSKIPLFERSLYRRIPIPYQSTRYQRRNPVVDQDTVERNNRRPSGHVPRYRDDLRPH